MRRLRGLLALAVVRPTNRWTGATGSDFRIKRDPAKLLGSAVARSTQRYCAANLKVKTVDSASCVVTRLARDWSLAKLRGGGGALTSR